MKTLSYLLPLVAVLGITACGTNDNENNEAASINDNTTTTVSAAKDEEVAVNEEAIVRRSARMDPMAECIRVGTADTWQSLSLTTDQIRWMEQLQGRMVNRNENASAAVNKDVASTTYTFSNDERRKLAKILTDDQLARWIEMCPQGGAITK